MSGSVVAMTRWGVLLPTFDPLRSGDPPRVAEAAVLAERLGFDGVWVGDHLACPAPVLDAPACLTVAASATDRVSVGFSVMLLGLRPVAWAAKQLATIQAISGGKLRLGVGVGGEFPQEFAAAGVNVRERGARLDQALSVLPDLLAGRPVRQRAAGLDLDVAPLEPAVDVPPVLVGGRGEAALRRAARFGDAWLPMWLTPDVVQRRAEQLAEMAAELGRPRPSLAMLIGVRVEDDLETARREAAAHLHGQYRLALDAVERWTLLGDGESVGERLDAYCAVGVEEFVLMPLGARPLEQFERLAAVIDARQTAPPVTETA